MGGHDDGTSAEDRLIARYFRPIAKHPGAFGLIDDAAALTPPAGCDLVLTTDGVIAGVHFFADDPPETIGRKALRMNLSDLAAKGATPMGFLLALALPAGTDETWLSAPRRRHRPHAGSALGVDRRLRHGAAWKNGAALNRKTRRLRGGHGYDR